MGTADFHRTSPKGQSKIGKGRETAETAGVPTRARQESGASLRLAVVSPTFQVGESGVTGESSPSQRLVGTIASFKLAPLLGGSAEVARRSLRCPAAQVRHHWKVVARELTVAMKRHDLEPFRSHVAARQNPVNARTIGLNRLEAVEDIG